MEIKYTKQGKKVVVLGKLNNNDFIVQEIYVSKEGAEIPGGENFIASGLLDEPMETWEEKRARENKERYERDRQNYEKSLDDLRKRDRTEMAALKAKIDCIKRTTENISLESFEMVENFLLEKYKYIVTGGYDIKLYDFHIERDLASFWDDRCEGLKLVSIYGKSDGTLQWRIHDYSDHSGGSKEVYLFCTLEEAKEKFASLIEAKSDYGSEDIKRFQTWGLPVNKEKVKKYISYKKENITKSIEGRKMDIEKLEEELKAIDSEFGLIDI